MDVNTIYLPSQGVNKAKKKRAAGARFRFEGRVVYTKASPTMVTALTINQIRAVFLPERREISIQTEANRSTLVSQMP